MYSSTEAAADFMLHVPFFPNFLSLRNADYAIDAASKDIRTGRYPASAA
jgi:hypothetical protein